MNMAVSELDFSKPPKFTLEIQRRLSGALEPFGEELGEWLANELGCAVTLSASELTQISWAEATERLAPASVAMAINADSIDRKMLLSVELPLLLQALECMLGASAEQAPPTRPLTALDWTLAKSMLEAIVRELSRAWEELDGPRLSLGELDAEEDGGVIVDDGEPTLCAELHSTIDGQSSSMTLLIPWSAVEPFVESLRIGSNSGRRTAVVDEPRALRRGVAGAQVLLRAEVGSLQMPVKRMLELLPGQLVSLQGRAEDGVLLFAEGVSLGRGRPGRSGANRAIKLLSTTEPAVRADVYAKLGRVELERARASVEAWDDGPDGGAILHSIFVRVWAELGRTHLPLGAALELTAGSVLELDQSADAPVELFANGLCFANGSLVITGEGAWGVQVAELV
jgi:flagellar motor switch protein FliM